MQFKAARWTAPRKARLRVRALGLAKVEEGAGVGAAWTTTGVAGRGYADAYPCADDDDRCGNDGPELPVASQWLGMLPGVLF
ncbi:MAG: hypothetical protein AAF645_04200, partial [Myxococcota bacterium]